MVTTDRRQCVVRARTVEPQELEREETSRESESLFKRTRTGRGGVLLGLWRQRQADLHEFKVWSI